MDEVARALAGCSIERARDLPVEIVTASPFNRAFPSRVGETLGVCLKLGGDHDVVADGRSLRYPANSVCVRAPGCVWSTAATGPVGFLSLDIEVSEHFAPSASGSMRFVDPRELPDLHGVVATLRSESSALAQETALSELVDRVAELGLVASEPHAAPQSSLAEQVRELLEANLAGALTLEQLAAATASNRFVLLREFRKRFGVPPHAFLLRRRVERARTMLVAGHHVADVAYAVGFSDQSHLTRAFKNVLGVAPGAYRRSLSAPLRPPHRASAHETGDVDERPDN